MGGVRLEVAIVPIAIGAEALLAVFLAVAIGVIALLILVVGIWGGMFVRDALSGVPVVGGTIRNAAQSLVDVQVSLAYRLEMQFAGSLYWAGSAVLRLFRAFLAPFVGPRDQYNMTTRAYVNAVTALAQTIWYAEIPALKATEATTASNVKAVTDLAQHIWYQELPRIAQIEQGLRGDVNAVTALAQYIWFHELVNMRAAEANLGARLGDLENYLDILRKLAGFESAVLGGLAGLEAALDRLSGRVGTVEQGLATVLPIAGALVVSVDAVQNLERLARDPCHCLNAGDMGDLPSRVDMLEVAGQ